MKVVRVLVNSIYNIEVVENDHILLFNTLTKSLVKLNSKERDIYLQAVREKDFLHTHDALWRLLQNEGFLVSETTNEKRLCDYVFFDKIFSNKSLDITIIPTDHCNFRCVYCYEESKNHFMDDRVANSIIRYIEKSVRFYHELSIDWFGGEPLLAKNRVIEMMQRIKETCRKNGVVMSSVMATNGYELDLETFTKLMSYGVRAFHISIDGNQVTHNRQRPHFSDPDSYTKIMGNLLQISRNIRSNRDRFSIGIRMNVSQENFYAVQEFADMFEKNFKDDKRFNIVWQWVRDWGGSRIRDNGTIDSLVSEESCVNLYDYSLSRGLLSDERLSCNSGREYCSASKNNGFVINYDGQIYKCSMAMEKREYRDIAHIGCIDPYGRLVFDNRKASEWIIPKQILSDCNTCAYYPMCMGAACPLSDNIIKGESRCMVYRSMMSQQIRNKKLHGKCKTIVSTMDGGYQYESLFAD